MAKQWRETYNQWEKAIAPGLEQITASDGFRDLMATSAKFTAAVTSEFERASRRWLHFWNLPAATDVRKLRQQVASIDREVKGLRNLVFEVVAAEPAHAPEPAVMAESPSPMAKPAMATGTAAEPVVAKPELAVVAPPAVAAHSV